MLQRNDLLARLGELAARGETTTYGALAQSLGWRVSHLTAVLEDLMAEDVAAGRPMRAALVAGRLSNGLPAQGFFDHAAQLGVVITDPAAFIAETRSKLFSRH